MVTVRGRRDEWTFVIHGNPAYLNDWLADDLEIVEVIHEIPPWLPACLVRPWCWVQDRVRHAHPSL